MVLTDPNRAGDQGAGMQEEALTKLDVSMERYKEKQGYRILALKEEHEIVG